MYLLATFLTTHFGEWRQTWHGMPRQTRVGGSLAQRVPVENEGALALLDWDSKSVVWTLTLDTPAGFCLVGDEILVASMYGNKVLRLGPDLSVRGSVVHGLMNDLHGITQTPRGVLLASSGVDGLLELTLDGNLLWSWLGPENGYKVTPQGTRRRVDRSGDHRIAGIATDLQATHCNSAVRTGDSVVLATLFHQGQIIQLERDGRRPQVLLFGMTHPHSLRRRSRGWLVCDSRPGSVVLLGEDFWVEGLIEDGFNWVQDAVETEPDRILIADANNARIVDWDVRAGHAVDELRYPEEWKIYQFDAVSPAWEQRLLASAGAVLGSGRNGQGREG